MPRITVRLIMALVLVFTIAVIVIALASLRQDSSAWATIAAALAVIAALVSSWTAQRVLEMQEDSLKPSPYPHFDAKSRFSLLQLRVTNFGGSPAHNIRLFWETPLKNAEGEQVRFSKAENAPEIPILLPKESLSILVDMTSEFLKKNENANFSGKIEFYDASGNKKIEPFYLSAEPYKEALYFSEEEPKTHHELQKLPEQLQKLTSEVRDLRGIFALREERILKDEKIANRVRRRRSF